MTEAGGNPIEGTEGGEDAEPLASTMAGLADTFGFITDDASHA